jgi:glutathione S-transferase
MKLIYFQARMRVEPARLMLELTGAKYEVRLVSLEEWMTPACKEWVRENTPFGQLPMLEDGELTLCQSMAINRYVGRKLGLCGDTALEVARIDEVTETGHELLVDIAEFHWNPRFKERRPEHREATGAKLERLDAYFGRRGAGPEHWISRDRYTMADAMMALALESVIPLHPGLLEGFPRLHGAMTAFFSAEGVRDYVRSDRRPKTFTVPLAQFGGVPEETHHWTG